jgi:peptide/nickel transport system substrate-binding protein
VDPTAHVIVLRANKDYPDPADKWLIFSEPKLPEVSVEGPVSIISGLGAMFNVKVNFKGQPYKVSEIDSVKYLVIDANDRIVATGTAEPVEDGLWSLGLEAAETSALPSGPAKLLVAVSSKLVSVPITKEVSFTALSLEEHISGKLGEVEARVRAEVEPLKGTISSLRSEIEALKTQISTLSILMVVSVVVAIIAIAVAAIALVRRKK